MTFTTLLTLLLLLLSLLLCSESANYEIVADERMLMPCGKDEDQGNMAVSDFVDISNLQLVLDKDLETLHISCDITVKKQLPDVPIQMQVDVLHWERGQWVPTVIALKRNDICKSLADPFEIWHYVIAQIPKEERVCPPKLGHVYRLRNLKNRMTIKNFPRWNIEGYLKSVVHFTAGEMKCCALGYETVKIV